MQPGGACGAQTDLAGPCSLLAQASGFQAHSEPRGPRTAPAPALQAPRGTAAFSSRGKEAARLEKPKDAPLPRGHRGNRGSPAAMPVEGTTFFSLPFFSLHLISCQSPYFWKTVCQGCGPPC